MQTNDTSEVIILEKDKMLSESLLWQWQKDYYAASGINAWVSQIPFEVTCNPFIANSYAHIAVSFIRDVIAKQPDAANHPFYLIELGTGSGKFSFYTIKTILELLSIANMKNITIRYIMSDFTDHNIKYYKSHLGLKKYIDAGVLDFAIFELESSKPVTLQLANKVLDQKTLVNPIIIFANYVFDTASHDAFYINDKKIHPLHITIKNKPDNVDHDKIKNMENLEITFSESRNTSFRYQDQAINQILDLYQHQLKDTNVLIPIGALKAINYLSGLANDRMLLISTDKGNSSMASLENLGPPAITFHGSSCFSLMVNYDALFHYFKNKNGDAFLETSRDKVLETGVFMLGYHLNELPETSIAIRHYIEETSPCDIYKIDKRIRESFEECDLDTLATHLSLTHWNPTIYSIISSRVESLLPDAENDIKEYLAKNMHKLAENYYYMPKADSTLFQVGLFFHLISRFDEAIPYYLSSLPFDKDLYYINYNLALCYYGKHDPKSALPYFEKALAINPESTETKNMIETVKKMMQT